MTTKKSSKRQSSQPRSRIIIIAAVLAVSLGMGALFMISGSYGVKQEAIANVTVYKSPTCGCCNAWVDHLQDNGFEVEVVNQNDVTPLKRQFGVPKRLYSCHTATVNGYTVEGHVPVDDIKRLLTEKPEIKGLAVPGMPQGAPGMETGRVDSYSVVAFDEQKKTHIFNRY